MRIEDSLLTIAEKERLKEGEAADKELKKIEGTKESTTKSSSSRKNRNGSDEEHTST